MPRAQLASLVPCACTPCCGSSDTILRPMCTLVDVLRELVEGNDAEAHCAEQSCKATESQESLLCLSLAAPCWGTVDATHERLQPQVSILTPKFVCRHGERMSSA